MPIIKIETTVKAPLERVFDLARCIDLHEATMLKHKEKAVGGKIFIHFSNRKYATGQNSKR